MTSAADVVGWLGRRLRRAPDWPSPKHSPASLRVLTWNIHHGADPSGHVDLERIAAIIARVHPDLVGLQELDRHWGERSAGQDQPGWLAQRLGMHAVFGATVVRPRPDGPDREYGIALLGREPWSHVRQAVYPPVGRLEPRGYLVATASNGLRICCTHLSAGAKATAGPVRDRQVAHLIQAMHAQPPPVALVVGDFNAAGLARPVLAMRRHWVDAVWQAGVGRTSTLVGPSPRRLDYVWVDPSWAVEQAVVLQTAVSDHRPVVVDVRRRDVSV